QPPPPRAKGRPRSATADQAILDAARAALAELGWGGLTMGDVAVRAGVAKPPLYRRWPSKNELVIDAIASLFDQLEMVDRGSLQ
ncbi:TetR family transcriptional regulator, partial [Streptomyces tateyamensis]